MGVAVGVGVLVDVAVAVGVIVGVKVGVEVGVRVGVTDAVAVRVAVGRPATGVAIGAGPHATNNKMLKYTIILLLESRCFISPPVPIQPARPGQTHSDN